MEGYRPKKLNGILDSERAMVQIKKSFEACFARRMEAVINTTGSYIKSNTRYLSNPDSFWSAVHIVFLISVSNNIAFFVSFWY